MFTFVFQPEDAHKHFTKATGNRVSSQVKKLGIFGYVDKWFDFGFRISDFRMEDKGKEAKRKSRPWVTGAC
jgi:hypothetical protein